ncbi:MAG: glutathione peroxidase [Burkholderiales bacterium]|jgi:glutathione peroxidase|nr:glutathione peroxidase [Burkholderiales bacterium]
MKWEEFLNKSIYDYTVTDIDGNTVSLDKYKDKVLLIVNTASKCGFTKQYAALEELYKKYKDKGLVVLGFPCNQFANQEPGDMEEIKNFCSLTYSVDFPMFAKIEVNGKNTHPLYVFLKKKARGVLGTLGIKWNFTKFLVDKSGNVVKRYAPAKDPLGITGNIEKLL